MVDCLFKGHWFSILLLIITTFEITVIDISIFGFLFWACFELNMNHVILSFNLHSDVGTDFSDTITWLTACTKGHLIFVVTLFSSMDIYTVVDTSIILGLCANSGTKGVASTERAGKTSGTGEGSYCATSSCYNSQVHASFSSCAGSSAGAPRPLVIPRSSRATHYYRASVSRGSTPRIRGTKISQLFLTWFVVLVFLEIWIFSGLTCPNSDPEVAMNTILFLWANADPMWSQFCNSGHFLPWIVLMFLEIWKFSGLTQYPSSSNQEHTISLGTVDPIKM